jgi:hypothetical protein
MEENMARQNMIVIAVGTFALSAFPLACASAQSVDTVANAENSCAASGVTPNTAAFDTCVGRSALDDDHGGAGMATQQAQAEPRSAQAYSAETPHATASVDSFGFHYDRQGNVLDRDGYVIRPVPY